MADTASLDPAERFSLVAGGPFHTALTRLGLIGPDQLPTLRAATGLALLAWMVPALLAAAQSLFDPRYSGWSFFSDTTVYTRYLVAIWAMVATERYADGRVILLVRQFRHARLLSDADLPKFNAALRIADQRSSSALAEGIIAASAVAWTVFIQGYVVSVSGSSWEGGVSGGAISFSWAGLATVVVSNPLFLFLVLRWVWRFVVWTALLYRISRLPLQLTPMHPDRSGGLGFLAIYPSVFSGFVFALSCVIASSIAKEFGLEQHDPNAIWFAVAGWPLLSLVLFLGPLLVFVRPIYAVRERALLDYGRLAAQHHLAFHRKWIGEARTGEEIMGSGDPSSASDLNASVEIVSQLRLVPVDRAAVVQLVASAGVPMLAAVATQIPIFELLKWLAGTIL